MAATIALCGITCSAAVNITLTPSATSNTYTGPITLNITGLSTGQPVRVQTYLDLNSNGVIQANDPLIDVFDVTDGVATVIGGITNISEPYDRNPAAGAITATLNFAPSLENIVGQKIYQVISDPPGAFTPVTAVLAVTNAPTGILCTGVVYSNGVVPMHNAVVVALTAANQKYIGATIADAQGNYALALLPGAYFLLPGRPGYYTDQDILPLVTLTNGMSVTNNLVMTNGTVAISGSVYDQANSNGLGGVFLQAQFNPSQNSSLFEVLFTDTNGNYTFLGTSNNWKLKTTADRLARRGYLSKQGNAVTAFAGSGPVTNANIGLYHGNAMFYGQVTISNVPVPNVPIDCSDNQQILSGKTFTDPNGNYAVVALVNTNLLGTNANWFCSPNLGDETGAQVITLANYIFSEVDNVSLTNNQAFLQNFIGLPVTATISGQVVNNLGAPVSHLGIGANSTINGTNEFTTAYVDTDSNGDYSFGAASGQWYLNANCCGSDGLDTFGYYDPANFHLVNIPPTNPVVNIVVYPANLPILGQPGRVSSSQFNFNLYGASGFNYTVQANSNLVSTNWSVVTVVSNLPGSPYLIQDFQATNAIRFYRAFESP